MSNLIGVFLLDLPLRTNPKTSRPFSQLRRAVKVTAFQVSSILLFAVFIALTASAQTTSATDGSTPLALQPGAPAGSFQLSGFESVNPYNGNLNFHLSLLGISGRGGAGMASMLEIDSLNRNLKQP